MAFTETATADLAGHPLAEVARSGDSPSACAVSWGAILAGAAAAAALSLILLLLGLGLGLSSISPWSQRGVGAATFGISTILWITVTQLLSSGMGGYLAGRLRSKWVAVHQDEAYFRDTAHGFLSWAVASLAAAALIGSILGSVLSGGLQAGASVAGGAAGATAGGVAAMAGGPDRIGAAGEAAGGRGSGDSTNYFIDSLFRQSGSTTASPPAADPAGAAASPAAGGGTAETAAASAAEVSRIFIDSISSGTLPADDLHYVGRLVSQRTGLDTAAAEQRVSQVYARLQGRLQEAATRAKEAADKARKATVYATLWLFVSLLAGAFAASLSATYGGRQRDL